MIASMVGRKIHKTEGNIDKGESMISIFGNEKLSRFIETNMDDNDKAELEELLEKERLQLSHYQALRDECIEVLPEFKRAYEVNYEADRLKDAMVKADAWSEKQKALVDRMKAFDLENHLYISVLNQEKPWVDFDYYYKGYEEKNAGK
jgi:hypothetical protein